LLLHWLLATGSEFEFGFGFALGLLLGLCVWVSKGEWEWDYDWDWVSGIVGGFASQLAKSVALLA